MGRIKGERVNINANNVSAFFSNRVKKDLPYRYNYTHNYDKLKLCRSETSLKSDAV